MGVWTSRVCDCACMAVSVCQGTCAGAGRALLGSRWGLGAPTPHATPWDCM